MGSERRLIGLAMLDDLKAHGVMREGFDDTLKVARSLDEIAGFIG